MPKSPSSPQPLQPLNAGNVVSTGLRIYRDHFKLYFSLAIQALLWSLVPFYGWAKNCQIQAIISRQVYKELLKKPEAISTTRTHISQRFWSYWAAQFFIGIMSAGAFIGSSIILNIIFLIPKLIVANSSTQNSASSLIALIIDVIATLIPIIIYIWLYSHFFVSELPLSIESNMNSTNSLGRSWELTKGFVVRVQTIVIIAGLITLPIVLFTLVPVFFIFSFLMNSSSPDTILVSSFLIVFLGMFLGIVGATFMMPFWQAIKAVIYYDIRNRREGLGLQVRDSHPQ